MSWKDLRRRKREKPIREQLKALRLLLEVEDDFPKRLNLVIEIGQLGQQLKSSRVNGKVERTAARV